jgi:hypothetical protein
MATVELAPEPATARTTRPAIHVGDDLRSATAPTKLSFRWLGVTRSLSGDQKQRAAGAFGAEQEYLRAGKKILDTNHPAYKAVTAIRSQARSYWREISLPYPEPGIRLIPRGKVDQFVTSVESFRRSLSEAVYELEHHYRSLRDDARRKLGDLFNASDYPDTLTDLFSIEYEFPSVEPPNYLFRLDPELYETECSRMRARFDEAVQLAEQAFLEELGNLVSHLSERLTDDSTGPKVFRDSAVQNFSEFFQRFRELNVKSNPELEELVVEAEHVIRGLGPQALRDNRRLRQQVVDQLREVGVGVDSLLVDRPRRRIIRSQEGA